MLEKEEDQEKVKHQEVGDQKKMDQGLEDQDVGGESDTFMINSPKDAVPVPDKEEEEDVKPEKLKLDWLKVIFKVILIQKKFQQIFKKNLWF